MTRILVTGGTGFIGTKLIPTLLSTGAEVIAAVRNPAADDLPHLAGARLIAVADIGPDTEWAEALRGVDTVVHLAARVHVMRETTADPLAAFRRTNVEGTQRLAQAAVAADVGHFILLSSVKVGGEATAPGEVLDERRPPAAVDSYGLSKAEAEAALANAAGSAMRWMALRPPLVYGPGVKGNLRSLLRLCDSAMPLPVASIDNRRSVIGVGNLADAIRTSLECADMESGAYYVSDGEDVSTPELVRRLAAALGRPARLFPVPPPLLRAAARVAGRQGQADRLLGSLQVDSGRFRRSAGWTPPISMLKELSDTAQWYRETVCPER